MKFPGAVVWIGDGVVEFKTGGAVEVAFPRPVLVVAFSGHVEAATYLALQLSLE